MKPKTGDFSELSYARSEWRKGASEHKLALFDAALAKQPHNIKALCESARAYGIQFHGDRAEELLNEALSICGSHPQSLHAIASSYKTVQRTDLAIQAYEFLRETNDTCIEPAALAELADLYEKVGRLDDALEAVDECLGRAPHRAEPEVIMGRLFRRLQRWSDSEKILEKAIRRRDIPPHVLAYAWGEVCHLRDATQDFDGAFAAIEKAKTILRKLPEAESLSRAALTGNARLGSIYQELKKSTIDRWMVTSSDLEDESPPVAHLLGFPRSGTTLLEQVLDAHPSVFDSPESAVFLASILPAMYKSAEPRKLGFASLNNMAASDLVRIRRRYFRLIESANGRKVNGLLLLDKNPNHTSAMAAILRLLPKVRFLVALRDPRDVVVSSYLRIFPLTEFSSWFLTRGSACALFNFEMGIWLHMRKLLNGNWLECRYEDTVADLEAQARKACDFLNLTWDPKVLSYRESIQNKNVNSPSHADVRQPISDRSVGRWRHYQKHFEGYFQRLSQMVKKLGYD